MKHDTPISRGDFLRSGLAASVSLPLTGVLSSKCAENMVTNIGDDYSKPLPGKIPLRRFGRTGVQVSMLGMGGAWWLQRTTDKEAVERFLSEAIDSGITYFDTAHGYKNSQSNLGLIMGTPRRKSLFLASKVGERTYDGAMQEFEENLKQLRVDTIDLLQIHHINPKEDVEALGKSTGVLAAMRKLREQKAIRFIGVTGHPQYTPVKVCLERYNDFDAFMCHVTPLPTTRPVFQDQLPVALSNDLGIIAMKVYGGGEPAVLIGKGKGKASASELLRFALSEDISVAVIAMSSPKQLRENVKIAREWYPMPLEEKTRLLDRFKDSTLSL